MMPLTADRPKALVKLAGKTLLEHTIISLPPEINELILVVGYLGEQIKKFCGDNFCGRKISYVWQKDQLGTGHALKLCRKALQNEKFLVMCADDLHGGEGIKNCLKHDLCLLAAERENPERFGVIVLNSDSTLKAIDEKPKNPLSNLVSTGVMALDSDVFNYSAEPALNGEFYLPRIVNKMAEERRIFVEKADFWHPIAIPDDVLLFKGWPSNGTIFP